MNKPVGILALQGAYQKHMDSLQSLHVPSRLIRQPDELESCSALIIPGGESTTVSLLIQEYGFYDVIKSFAENHPVMGVCAGMIMMATQVDDDRIKPLALMPFKALRNHYGRQLHSFTTGITLAFDRNIPFAAPFIRAPGIEEMAADIKVLATVDGKAVMIARGRHMALSFHPELTDDTRIHEYWLQQIKP